MQKALKTAIWFVGIIWAIYLLDSFLPGDWRTYGIRPRTVAGLTGIATMPFLHGGLAHIISNSIPLFILTAVLVYFYRRIWVHVCVLSVVLGGLAVWVLARSGTNHIGASGLIFSLMAFLMLSGLFRRTFTALIVALVVFFLYGGSLIFGVLPTQPGVSWEGHLFGAIAGGFLAWVYRNERQENKSIQ